MYCVYDLLFAFLHSIFFPLARPKSRISLYEAWLNATTLLFLNSSLNPIIYCWKMGPIRRTLMDIITQVEKDIDRIQTLIKKTIYFNLFRAHLISYFILILAFICISVYIYIYIYIYIYVCMYIYTHVYIGNLVLTTEMKT